MTFHALYFRKKGAFQELVDKGEKNWNQPEKKDLLRYESSMTARV